MEDLRLGTIIIAVLHASYWAQALTSGGVGLGHFWSLGMGLSMVKGSHGHSVRNRPKPSGLQLAAFISDDLWDPTDRSLFGRPLTL